MARLIITPKFRSDTREILKHLEQVAGPAVAARYNRRFRRLMMHSFNFRDLARLGLCSVLIFGSAS
jgi:plasmid stabilization system protein ParE